MTPMIDVVFLLVIFFMVGSKFSEAEGRIKVNVPSVAEMQSIARQPDERVVSVAQNGDITLDGQVLSIQKLKATLGQQFAVYPGLRVSVHGDANAPWQRVTEVLNTVDGAGVGTIQIATRSRGGSAR